MSQTRLAQLKLLRHTKSLPLRLPQNSWLKINSRAPVPVNVRLLPEWRDDGKISLQHIIDSSDDQANNIDWKVNVQDGEKNGLTSVEVEIHESDAAGVSIPELEPEPLVVGEEYSSSSSFNGSEKTTMTVEHIDSTCLELEDKKIIPGITLIAHIPEKCNVTCKLHHGGDINIQSKLEGEHGFDLSTSGGNISLQKLRGDSIKLDTKFEEERGIGGVINARKSLEAQNIDIVVGKGGRFRAKMMNVSDANIECDDGGKGIINAVDKLDDDDIGALIDVSSIYTSMTGEGAHMTVNNAPGTGDDFQWDDSLRKVRVKSSHGHISVNMASSFKPQPKSLIIDKFDQRIPHVDLGGINGSFDLSITKLGSMIGSESSNQDEVSPMAAKVHIDSLSPGQASILTSDFGDVDISLDRKIESDIRILSAPMMNNLDPGVLLIEDEEELVESLVEHNDDIEQFISTRNSLEDADNGVMNTSKLERISLETEAFSGYRNFDMDHVEYVCGAVDNKSQEPDSRFDVKTKGLTSVGKIRIDGAAGQALHGFSGGTSTENEEDGDGKAAKGIIDMPLLAIATDGRVKLESLSWFGAIARRYGVEDESRGVGRQAKKSLKRDNS